VIGKILGMIGVEIMFFVLFWALYFAFYYAVLSAEVAIKVGKKSLRNKRRKYKGFWKKFLFLDFREKISPWYYFWFIVFLVTYPCLFVVIELSILFETVDFRLFARIVITPLVASLFFMYMAHRRFYDHTWRR